ncbi:hypothetical protein DERF_004513, partial [Dermatophagoides farinae]
GGGRQQYDYSNNPQPYLSSSSYQDRSYQQPQQQQQLPPPPLPQQQPQLQAQPAPPQPPPPPPMKPSYPPSLNLKPPKPTTAKNPYGQTGPYGIDATNPYVDYYRKLYYPYDPITGEYMKDATPPGGDTGTTNLLPNVMPDSMANQMLGRSYASTAAGGRYGGNSAITGGIYGNDPTAMMMMNNYYGGGGGQMYGDHEQDSLLLCCDFLIPRPNIKCLLITLFILLVLIILIAVIRFLVSLSGDQSEELATLLEQTCMLLLIGALGDLLWIIGVYFTSRRTRHQIATILSCATNSHTIETTLTNDYNNNGYLYPANNPIHQQQQQQQLQHQRSYIGGGIGNQQSGIMSSGGGGGGGLGGNYRYNTNSALIKQQINHQNSHHSSTTTIFVINLAIADLLFCSLVMPLQSGRYLTRSWPFGQLLCRLYPLFYYGTVATSLMMITAITINRFILIAFNRHYSRIYNRKNVIIMIIFCWLFSYTLVSIPVLKLYGQTGYQSNTFSCTILRDQRERSPKKFLFILGFFLPMTTIVFCYGMILFHIKRQQHKRQTKTTQNNGTIMINNNNTTNRDLRLTLLICVVFGAFLACFLPLFIGNVFIPDDRYPYFHVFASIFAWMNSCINPFIYFVMNQRYRQAYKKLFFGNFFFKKSSHHHHHML